MLTELFRLIRILPRRYWTYAVLLLAAMVVAAAFEVVGIGILPLFVQLLADPGALRANPYAQPVLARLPIASDLDLIYWGCGAVAAVFAVKNLYLILVHVVESRFATAILYHLGSRTFASYVYAPYAFHIDFNSATAVKNLASNIHRLWRGFVFPLFQFSISGIAILGIALLLLYQSSAVALAVLGAAAVLNILVNRLLRKTVRGHGEAIETESGRIIRTVQDALGSVKEMIILGTQPKLARQFNGSNGRLMRAYRLNRTINSSIKPMMELIAILSLMGVILALLLAGKQPIQQILPSIVLIGVAIARLAPMSTQMIQALTDLRTNTPTLRSVLDDIAAVNPSSAQAGTPALAAPKAADSPARTARVPAPLARMEGTLAVRELTFRYRNAPAPALKQVNLEIPLGSVVAFVGPTGSGKTTLVDVLLGLLRAEAGQVLLNGADIHDDIAAWHADIGYVPQAIFLLDESIRRNVALAEPDDSASDEKVWAALRQAHVDEFVRGLPQGLDTVVGERGARLSGGQRQRIGIARALYRDPSVVVMDEGTSALDSATEKSVVDDLVSLRGQRTVIIISHRLGTVRACDRVFMLDDGRILASGSYDELLAAEGGFRKIAL